MERPRFKPAMLHPQYWPVWFGFACWWALAQLPYAWQLRMGRWLGALLFRFAKRRVFIARRNLELCFPERSPQEREALLKKHFENMGIAVFETGMAWFWPASRLDKIYQVEGLEILKQAQAEGVGVMLLGCHWTHLDMGKLMGRCHQVDTSYRPHENPVYDLVQRWGRERLTQKAFAIHRKDVRGMIRAFREGRVMWYAPDQDYGRKHSIFVPFFGVPAATVTATGQLARMGKARVVPYLQTRLEGAKGYKITIYPPWENFPSDNEEQDVRRVNELVESFVLKQPDQYLWVHRRFKTRPEGQESVYKR